MDALENKILEVEKMLSHGERDFKKLNEPLKKYELFRKLDDDLINNIIEIAKKEIESVTDLRN